MSIEHSDDDIVQDAEKWLLRQQAQAMLNLFEEDRGRPAATMDEVRAWSNAQSHAHLQSRVNRLLGIILN
jgi:hypothetical protein